MELNSDILHRMVRKVKTCQDLTREEGTLLDIVKTIQPKLYNHLMQDADEYEQEYNLQFEYEGE